MTKPMIFNFFLMDTPSHIFHGTWRHPQSRSIDYADLDLWTELAVKAEEAKVDAIFMADNFGLYEEAGDRIDRVVSNAVQVPCNDPMMLISAMSAATKNLCFVYTSSILQQHPSPFARQTGSLDHLTKGRIGWNIVTSFVKNAAASVGEQGSWDHSQRYAWAEEYVDLTYKLWEGSWDDGAVVANKETGVYADPAKVHRIRHQSARYSVEGPFMVAPSPQRTPVLFQAGTSSAGQAFAAKNAEGVFLISGTPKGAGKAIRAIKEQARDYGRNPEDIVFLEGLTFVVGRTEEEAQRKEAEIEAYIDEEVRHIMLAGAVGIDTSTYPPETLLVDLMEKAQGMKSRFEAVMNASGKGAKATLADLSQFSSRSLRIVGTPESICDRIEEYQAQGIDGFNIIYMLLPGTYVDFIELLAPELKKRGLMRTEYSPGTFREKIFGAGAKLNPRHPGAKYKNAFADAFA